MATVQLQWQLPRHWAPRCASSSASSARGSGPTPTCFPSSSSLPRAAQPQPGRGVLERHHEGVRVCGDGGRRGEDVPLDARQRGGATQRVTVAVVLTVGMDAGDLALGRWVDD
ncbi:hypothetical protein BS78_03G147600 [Paspalum vaginatum]|nr:hypothetical protein BS78_03G147600 [Paspalum vaginatum]